MFRLVIGFLLSVCVLSGAIALDIVENSDGLIRLPLTRISREADGLTKIVSRNNRNVQYGVPVEMGTPPQKFSLLLDSGSTDLWVSSTAAKGITKGIDNFFDESASSSFQKQPGTFYLGFIGASVNGTIGMETVTIGGLTVKNQPLGLVFTGGEATTPFDGIAGISYPIVAQTDDSTLIDRLKDQGLIKKRISCVKFFKKEKSESEFIIGGCDVEAKYWIPVMQINNQYTGWRVNLTKLILRSTTDNSELLTLEPNNEAVFDTGAGDSIRIPQKFLDPIANSLASNYNGQHYLVDCSNRTSLPNIEFYFGEAKLVMPLDTYSWVYFDECQIGLKPGGEDFLFGSLFFNLATVIFDRESDRIGLTPI